MMGVNRYEKVHNCTPPSPDKLTDSPESSV